MKGASSGGTGRGSARTSTMRAAACSSACGNCFRHRLVLLRGGAGPITTPCRSCSRSMMETTCSASFPAQYTTSGCPSAASGGYPPGKAQVLIRRPLQRGDGFSTVKRPSGPHSGFPHAIHGGSAFATCDRGRLTLPPAGADDWRNFRRPAGVARERLTGLSHFRARSRTSLRPARSAAWVSGSRKCGSRPWSGDGVPPCSGKVREQKSTAPPGSSMRPIHPHAPFVGIPTRHAPAPIIPETKCSQALAHPRRSAPRPPLIRHGAARLAPFHRPPELVRGRFAVEADAADDLTPDEAARHRVGEGIGAAAVSADVDRRGTGAGDTAPGPCRRETGGSRRRCRTSGGCGRNPSPHPARGRDRRLGVGVSGSAQPHLAERRGPARSRSSRVTSVPGVAESNRSTALRDCASGVEPTAYRRASASASPPGRRPRARSPRLP
jgi:hypothetical protein